MLWSTRGSSSRCVIAAFCPRKRSDLVLQIHVAPQASLAHVVAGASEAILAANFAAAKLVVLVGIGGNVRLGDESFTHAAQKLQADPDEAPEAERASWSRRVVRCLACIGGELLVLGFLETSWLALVRVVVGVAEPDIHSIVPAPALRIFL